MERFLVLVPVILLLVSACSDDGGSSSCDKPLTVTYVNDKINGDSTFVLRDVTATETRLIHSDGDQGNSLDIDKIFLSQASSNLGNTLALSYNLHDESRGDAGFELYAAFYIDTDSNAVTGEIFGDIGAEVVIVEDISGFGVQTSLLTPTVAFATENSGWVRADVLATDADHFHGCSMSNSIFIPWYSGLANVDLSEARGVLALLTYNDGNLNAPPLSISDTSQVFSFSYPSP